MLTHYFFVSRYFDDEEQQRYSSYPIKHGSINKGLYRVDTHKIDDEPDNGGYSDNAIKATSLFQFVIEAGIPVKGFGYSVRRRTRQHGHGQKAQPQNAYRENELG